jgi:hypothetical protein
VDGLMRPPELCEQHQTFCSILTVEQAFLALLNTFLSKQVKLIEDHSQILFNTEIYRFLSWMVSAGRKRNR